MCGGVIKARGGDMRERATRRSWQTGRGDLLFTLSAVLLVGLFSTAVALLASGRSLDARLRSRTSWLADVQEVRDDLRGGAERPALLWEAVEHVAPLVVAWTAAGAPFQQPAALVSEASDRLAEGLRAEGATGAGTTSAVRELTRALDREADLIGRDVETLARELEQRRWALIWLGVLALGVAGVLKLVGAGLERRRVPSSAVDGILARVHSMDVLTGALDRQGVHEALDQVVQRAARVSAPVALVTVEVDDFAALDGLYGSGAGDVFLREAHERLSLSVREGDPIGRPAGGRFVVVLPRCGREAATRVAMRVCRAFDAGIELGGLRIQRGVSVGVAVAEPAEVGIGRALQAASLEAMEEARLRGGGQVIVAEPGQLRLPPLPDAIVPVPHLEIPDLHLHSSPHTPRANP